MQGEYGEYDSRAYEKIAKLETEVKDLKSRLQTLEKVSLQLVRFQDTVTSIAVTYPVEVLEELWN